MVTCTDYLEKSEPLALTIKAKKAEKPASPSASFVKANLILDVNAAKIDIAYDDLTNDNMWYLVDNQR